MKRPSTIIAKASSLEWKNQAGLLLFGFIFVSVAVTCLSFYLFQLTEDPSGSAPSTLRTVAEAIRSFFG